MVSRDVTEKSLLSPAAEVRRGGEEAGAGGERVGTRGGARRDRRDQGTL